MVLDAQQKPRYACHCRPRSTSERTKARKGKISNVFKRHNKVSQHRENPAAFGRSWRNLPGAKGEYNEEQERLLGSGAVARSGMPARSNVASAKDGALLISANRGTCRHVKPEFSIRTATGDDKTYNHRQRSLRKSCIGWKSQAVPANRRPSLQCATANGGIKNRTVADRGNDGQAFVNNSP